MNRHHKSYPIDVTLMRKQRSDIIDLILLSLFILIKLGMVIYLPHIICTKYLRENQGYTNNSKEKKFSTKKRILLVDDELDITSSLKMGLEDNGFVVNAYNDAVLALSDFKSGVFDLVLLDIKMPQINGFELYEKIKEIDSNVKACFITAHEVYYESLKEIFPTMDCDCYVKPIKMEDLVRRVEAHLSN